MNAKKCRIIYAVRLLLFLFVVVNLSASCTKSFGLKATENTATAVFDDIVQIIDRHYSLFGVKQKDWSSIQSKYADLVNDTMNESQLFEVCSDMLQELEDGHVSLQAPFRTSTYDNFYKLFPRNFNFLVIEKKYLKEKLKKAGPFIYAIDQQIGYLYYSSFGDDFKNEELENVFNELGKTNGLIIDVRDNGGGKGANLNRLAEKFIKNRQLMKHEQHKVGPGHDQFSDPVAFYLNPALRSYDKQVVLLTNRKCFSACNDFVSFLSALNNVQVVGDQTGGGGSIPNTYLLVNGWKLQYSATITLSADKTPIDSGILPDFRVNISPIDEANGLDPILEKAVIILR